jgi:hypothetical protein
LGYGLVGPNGFRGENEKTNKKQKLLGHERKILST